MKTDDQDPCEALQSAEHLLSDLEALDSTTCEMAEAGRRVEAAILDWKAEVERAGFTVNV